MQSPGRLKSWHCYCGKWFWTERALEGHWPVCRLETEVALADTKRRIAAFEGRSRSQGYEERMLSQYESKARHLEGRLRLLALAMKIAEREKQSSRWARLRDAWRRPRHSQHDHGQVVTRRWLGTTWRVAWRR